MSTGTHGAPPAPDTRVIGRRVAATIIDTLPFSALLIGPATAVDFVEGLQGGRAEAIVDGLANRQLFDGVYAFVLGGGTLLAFALVIASFAYYAIMEGRYGQTLGKMALGIKVVREDGGPIGSRAAVLRTLMRFVDQLLVFYEVALVTALVSKRNRRLGDMVAKTLVVRA